MWRWGFAGLVFVAAIFSFAYFLQLVVSILR